MRRLFRWTRSPRARSLVGLGCLALMLVAANILAAHYLPQRLDLTEERLYTLSQGTRRTLAHIDEPITLRFYYSPRLGEAAPAYAAYAQRVRRLLGEYAAAAPGKLRLEIYQPQPFSEAEDRAVAFGLQAVPLNSQGEQVYFGLAGTNSTDDQQIIPFFAPERERLLEYDLTRLVHTLAAPKRIVVGLLAGLPLDGDPAAALRGRPSRPMAVLRQLRQLADVEKLPAALDAIPAGTDVLLLVHPHDLPERTLFAIDQFVLRGGKAIVFVDPYSELAARALRPAAAGSDLARLFRAWGLRLVPEVVAGDRQNARRVAVPTGNGASEAMDYIGWLALRGSDLNRNDVITASLKQVTMASAGILEPLAGAGTTLEPLITTSPMSMKLPVDKVAGLPDVGGLLSGFKSDETRYVLAARVKGPAATAFPDGPPEAGKPAKPGEPAAPLRQSVQPINLVVVADTDLLDDRSWARVEDFFGRQVVVPIADNADFLANAVEVLAGGEDLIDLRSRGTSARPFEVVERLQRAADDRYAAEQRALEQRLKEAQAKLRDLTVGQPADANTALSAEQARTVAKFRADIVATRRELRGVQAALRRDIGRLQAILEFVDIALVPILVAATAILFGALRLRRWRRRPPAAA